MQQFKISLDAYKKVRKTWLMIFMPFLAAMAAIIMVVNAFSGQKDEMTILPWSIGFMLLFVGISVYRGFRKQKKFLMSYSVTLSDEGIVREQLNTPPLSISFMEIREITKTEKGHFTIKGVDKVDVIHIPRWIEQPDLLEERLGTLAPITVNKKDPMTRKYGWVLSLVSLGAMVAVFVSNNKWVVGICGMAAVGLMSWSLFQVRRSRNVPKNIKQRSWLSLIVIASILYLMYMKLTGSATF